MKNELINSGGVKLKTFAEALRAYADEAEKSERLELEVQNHGRVVPGINGSTFKIILSQACYPYEPKVSYYDQILASTDTITVKQIAKDYGMSAIALNKLLHKLGVQFKQSNQWMVYRKHAEQGYTKSKIVPFIYKNGEHGVKLYTQWTQKGRLFLYALLRRNGVLPLIEKESNV